MSRSQNRQAIQEATEQAEMLDLIQRPGFRAFLWRVWETAHMFSGTHGADALTSAYAEGRRSLGLEMLTMVSSVRPDALMLVLADTLSKPQQETASARGRYPELDTDDATDE